jgi:hypothetical protein
MDQSSAARAADKFRQLLDDGPEEEVLKRRAAVFSATFELIPDEAVWTCTPIGDPPELAVLAFADGMLYVLTVPPRDEDDRHAAAVVRAVSVNPKSGSAEVGITHKGSNSNPPADAVWRFNVEDISIVIPVSRDSEGFATDEGPLVKALAEAVGWTPAPGLFKPRTY